jgi:hypothetical protein
MSCTFQFPKAPDHLLQALHEVIPNCELLAQQLPETSISCGSFLLYFQPINWMMKSFVAFGMKRHIGYFVGLQA